MTENIAIIGFFQVNAYWPLNQILIFAFHLGYTDWLIDGICLSARYSPPPVHLSSCHTICYIQPTISFQAPLSSNVKKIVKKKCEKRMKNIFSFLLFPTFLSLFLMFFFYHPFHSLSLSLRYKMERIQKKSFFNLPPFYFCSITLSFIFFSSSTPTTSFFSPYQILSNLNTLASI